MSSSVFNIVSCNFHKAQLKRCQFLLENLLVSYLKPRILRVTAAAVESEVQCAIVNLSADHVSDVGEVTTEPSLMGKVAKTQLQEVCFALVGRKNVQVLYGYLQAVIRP